MDLTTRSLTTTAARAPLATKPQNWFAAKSLTKELLEELTQQYQALYESQDRKLVVTFKGDFIYFVSYDLEQYELLSKIMARIDKIIADGQEKTILQLGKLRVVSLINIPEQLIPEGYETQTLFSGDDSATVLLKLARRKPVSADGTYSSALAELIPQYRTENGQNP